MTAEEIARLLKGKRYKKGHWMAKCPHHRERTGSLSITDMGHGDVRLHCFGGCAQADVLRAAGLTWKDLRRGEVTPIVKQRMSAEESKKSLERQFGLVIVLGSVEAGKKAYWAAAERRIRGEIDMLRCRVEPEAVIREWQQRDVQRRIRKYGWDAMWEGINADTVATQENRTEGTPEVHSAVDDGRRAPAGC